MNTEKKICTITLTGRAPVAIDEAIWPVIARGEKDYDHNNQELDRSYYLTVRRHADGRALIYGHYSTSWQGEKDIRGGYVIAKEADIAATIAKVGELIRSPQHVIDECVANLPVETLD